MQKILVLLEKFNKETRHLFKDSSAFKKGDIVRLTSSHLYKEAGVEEWSNLLVLQSFCGVYKIKSKEPAHKEFLVYEESIRRFS